MSVLQFAGTKRARYVIVRALVDRRLGSRLLPLAFAAVIACTASGPSASPSPTEQAQGSPAPTATPLAPLRPARSVSTVGSGVAASGDFRGDAKSAIALVQDPTGDASLRITVREPSADGESFTDSVWLTTGPNTFRLTRAKFAVADVTADGKDDLVALYDESENRSGLLVFASTGSAFSPPQKWWDGEDYVWSRARAVLGGSFSGAKDGVLIAYQYDNFQVRIHDFESTGSAFTFTGTKGVFDSGPGQLDLSKARFAVGRFTRSGGADQLAAFYQEPNAKARLLMFDPSPNGLVLRNDAYTTNEGEYDLGRASFAAADVTGDGKDDLVAVYGDADGSAKVQVFDSGNAFRPAGGFDGWASLPAGASCAGATGLVMGDWNGDRRVDADAIAPADGVLVHSSVLRNMGGAFRVSSASPEETVCPRWPLTGLPLAGGSADKRPLYVKIDNNPHARPHYGITRADMVYEWLVEGLTTRLAAVFQSHDPNVIGSVRSARMTDAPVVPSIGGAFVYSGGGPEELMRIHYDAVVAARYVDLAPGYGWGYRVGFREAPYNYFTTYKALRSALAQAPEGDQPVSIPSWDFLPPSVTDPLAGGFAAGADATAITIPYRALFGVNYTYDPASRTYARFDDGVREVDGETGQAVAAKNIVVIQTEVHFTTEFGLDPAGNPKLDMTLTGTGKASVFRDGKRMDVTWTRPDIFDVFTLRTDKGEAVRLAPGQTWVHIVPSDWTIPSR